MVVPEPLRGMTASVFPSSSPGQEHLFEDDRRRLVDGHQLPIAVSTTSTTTLNGRSWTGAPNPDPRSVTTTIRRITLAAAAALGGGGAPWTPNPIAGWRASVR